MNKITLDGWTIFSERPASTTYLNEDKSRILKVVNNPNEDTLKTLQREFDLSERINAMGIPTPKVYEIVEVEGKGLATIYQNINNKFSISRALSKNPEDPEKYVDIFVTLATTLHSTEVTDSSIPSCAEKYKEGIKKCDGIFTDEEKDKLIKAIDSIPDTHTALHGDFHPGNFITGDEGDFAIDIGDFAYGNPMFDWAKFYQLAFELPDFVIDRLFHMSSDRIHAIFKESLMKAYNLTTDDEYDKLVEEILPLALISPVTFLGVIEGPEEDLRRAKDRCSYLK